MRCSETISDEVVRLRLWSISSTKCCSQLSSREQRRRIGLSLSFNEPIVKQLSDDKGVLCSCAAMDISLDLQLVEILFHLSLLFERHLCRG